MTISAENFNDNLCKLSVQGTDTIAKVFILEDLCLESHLTETLILHYKTILVLDPSGPMVTVTCTTEMLIMIRVHCLIQDQLKITKK